ncbi:hypothetical protein [Flavobacterium sp.]|uniref:hypothetical protein n=1 Tax=Flavobacterium sp. TaxID=239 RepID=UPI002615E65F|nr:hypothetical protein [Flavobacterium sp.]
MNLKDKIEKICADNGFKGQKELAEAINFPYTLFNKNVNIDRLSGDMIKAFVNSPKVNVDYIWLIRDSEEEFKEEPLQKLNKAMAILLDLREELTRESHV